MPLIKPKNLPKKDRKRPKSTADAVDRYKRARKKAYEGLSAEDKIQSEFFRAAIKYERERYGRIRNPRIRWSLAEGREWLEKVKKAPLESLPEKLQIIRLKAEAASRDAAKAELEAYESSILVDRKMTAEQKIRALENAKKRRPPAEPVKPKRQLTSADPEYYNFWVDDAPEGRLKKDGTIAATASGLRSKDYTDTIEQRLREAQAVSEKELMKVIGDYVRLLGVPASEVYTILVSP